MVDLPLWKILITWDHGIPKYLENNKNCSKPATSFVVVLWQIRGDWLEKPLILRSTDRFRGKITGKFHFSWEDRWFPVDFPVSQPIDPFSPQTRWVSRNTGHLHNRADFGRDHWASGNRNSKNELERSTMFHGKIHYFEWAIFNSFSGWWFQLLWKNINQLRWLFAIYGKIKKFQITNQFLYVYQRVAHNLTTFWMNSPLVQ